jgi:hypothetical protein
MQGSPISAKKFAQSLITLILVKEAKEDAEDEIYAQKVLDMPRPRPPRVMTLDEIRAKLSTPLNQL